MDTLLSGNVWKQIRPLARNCRRRVAALAYVSKDDLLEFRKNDLLVCDASNAAIKAGETSAKVLSELFDRGVKIYSHPNLHAKVVVMGSTVLIGSANLSAASTADLREASYLTSRAVVVSQAKAYIHHVRVSGIPVTRKFVERALRLKVNRRGTSHATRGTKARKFGSQFWVVSVKATIRDYEDEKPLIRRATKKVAGLLSDPEAEPGWIRLMKRDKFDREVKQGDTVVQIETFHHSNRVRVYEPTAVLLRQDTKNWSRIYIDDEESLTSVSWTAFNRIARRLGIDYITKNSCREVNPRDADLVQSIFRPELGSQALLG